MMEIIKERRLTQKEKKYIPILTVDKAALYNIWPFFIRL